jgi:spermidine synthase
VLLIGGGIAGDALEILRYPRVGRVAYAELDPAIVAAGRRLVPRSLDDRRISVQLDDGRRLVRRSHAAFDVIIVDLPDPSTALLNRTYTVEFFREARAALVPGGVLAFGLGRYENFAGPELARLLSCGRRSVLEAFSSVLMIPGARVFFVASDGPLDPDMAGRIEAAGVRPRLVNRAYLGATLTADRIADVARAASLPAGINTDGNPVLYYYEMRRWMSQFGGGGWLLPAAVVAMVIACGAARGPVRRAVFGAGFAASALEMVLLMGYQALYGSVYRQVGLLVTVFMGGLAAGAWLEGRFRGGMAPRRGIAFLSLAIGALAAGVPGLLRVAGSLGVPGDPVGQAAILAAGFALATLVGFQFALAGRTGGDGGGAAGLFGADLAGASLGALLGGPLLVPVAGVSGACLAIALLNAGAAALTLGKRPCTS